jgi:uncharacterized protein (TIGR02996 family)
MNQDDAFLQAICEEPDSDDPRLVYADWLEERGDPRGELIRLQCRLARMTQADPDWPACRGRAAELLDRHQAEWQGPLTGWPGYWRFRRGFIEELSVTEAELLARADELFQLFPLRRLTVRPPVRDPAALAALPWLGRLARLDLGRCELRGDRLAQLLASPFLPRLSGLFLNDNGLVDEDARLLAATPALAGLTALHLGGANRITDAGAAAWPARRTWAGWPSCTWTATPWAARGRWPWSRRRTCRR